MVCRSEMKGSLFYCTCVPGMHHCKSKSVIFTNYRQNTIFRSFTPVPIERTYCQEHISVATNRIVLPNAGTTALITLLIYPHMYEIFNSVYIYMSFTVVDPEKIIFCALIQTFGFLRSFYFSCPQISSFRC